MQKYMPFRLLLVIILIFTTHYSFCSKNQQRKPKRTNSTKKQSKKNTHQTATPHTSLSSLWTLWSTCECFEPFNLARNYLFPNNKPTEQQVLETREKFVTQSEKKKKKRIEGQVAKNLLNVKEKAAIRSVNRTTCDVKIKRKPPKNQ